MPVEDRPVTQWRWGRAGVRLTAAEHDRRRHARAYRRHQERLRADQDLQKAYAGWRLGLVAPWRITHALDAGGHEGPQVDIACGTAEPAVDEWESGHRYPTFEQLLLLAELTGFSAAWFVRTEEPLDPRHTTMWGHMTQRERESWTPPILVCSADAVTNCPGTADYLETYLF